MQSNCKRPRKTRSNPFFIILPPPTQTTTTRIRRTKAQVFASMAIGSLHCLTSSSGFSPFSRFETHYHQNHEHHKKMMISMSSSSSASTSATHKQNRYSNWLKSMNAEIDAHIAKSIPLRPPVSVVESMQYLVFSAPRSLAPALCLAACELVGSERDQAIAAASALHLIHAAAFTHENLPLSDRPPATGNHKYGPNIELLTGDGILPFAYELIAGSDDNSSSSSSSEKILRVIIEIAKASGARGMVDGQCGLMMQRINGHGHENWHEHGGHGHGHGWVREVSEKKEGRLCGCGAACGAILGGGSEEEIEKLRNYGKYVGMVHGMMKLMDELYGGSSSSLLSPSPSLSSLEKKKELLEEVERLRFLGTKELESLSLSDKHVEAISCLMKEESFLLFQ